MANQCFLSLYSRPLFSLIRVTNLFGSTNIDDKNFAIYWNALVLGNIRIVDIPQNERRSLWI